MLIVSSHLKHSLDLFEGKVVLISIIRLSHYLHARENKILQQVNNLTMKSRYSACIL